MNIIRGQKRHKEWNLKCDDIDNNANNILTQTMKRETDI